MLMADASEKSAHASASSSSLQSSSTPFSMVITNTEMKHDGVRVINLNHGDLTTHERFLVTKVYCVLRAVKFLGNPDEMRRIRDNLLVAGKFEVYVASFEMAIKEKSTLRCFSWHYIIIDGVHRIKNENPLLSKTMRLYSANCRLLIMGTPLQNKLHELWSLLNFLMPEIFSSAETFDEW